MSEGKIRVLVVEDSAVARQLLLRILGSDDGIEVVGTASDGEEALLAFRETRPDLVTMDIHMPRLDGFEATRRIMETAPVPVVIVTASAQPHDLAKGFRVMEAGAVAIVEKPYGPGHANHIRLAANLIQTVKLMAQVKVVKRLPRGSLQATAAPPAHSRVAPRAQGLAIVAIGASTGGPPVLRTILGRLPSDFAVPILVVQHISGGFVEGLAEWLDKSVALRVQVAVDGEYAAPGRVYLAPDGAHMLMENGGRIRLSDEPPEAGLRPAVAALFRSVKHAYGPKAAGVLLTGMGCDGAVELRLMRAAGAATFAQDKESSVIFGMPGEAVKIGGAEFVLPPHEIASALIALTSRMQRTVAV